MSVTYKEALREAVYSIIEADLTAHQTRIAVMSLIPKEFHVIHGEVIPDTSIPRGSSRSESGGIGNNMKKIWMRFRSKRKVSY